MTKILIALAVLMSPTALAAKTPSFETLSEMAITYASQIGCVGEGTKVDPKNVTKFIDERVEIEDAYIVMVLSDLGCAGGTGTNAFNLFLLERASGRSIENDPDFNYLRVNPEVSQPVATSNGPRAITSVYQKNGQLFATGLEYGYDDSNCCPSLKTIYKVALKRRSVEISENDYRTFYSWDFTLTGYY